MKPSCTVCDGNQRTGFAPGTLDDLRRILGPNLRHTIGGGLDLICWRCQKWVATYTRVVL